MADRIDFKDGGTATVTDSALVLAQADHGPVAAVVLDIEGAVVLAERLTGWVANHIGDHNTAELMAIQRAVDAALADLEGRS